ncbi:hypothetical protein [Prevotella pallens]|uniref:hypothetical protein n=1 Tax=Prevotella pallens TaxID=60133 RepID=UPI001CB0F53E|nr:hypothetical protein [Prevotella pallens]MBF1464794.1 hypothetical protein [Prevotella pallens]
MKNRILLPLICMAISIFAASCSSEAVDYPEEKEQMITLSVSAGTEDDASTSRAVLVEKEGNQSPWKWEDRDTLMLVITNAGQKTVHKLALKSTKRDGLSGEFEGQVPASLITENSTYRFFYIGKTADGSADRTISASDLSAGKFNIDLTQQTGELKDLKRNCVLMGTGKIVISDTTNPTKKKAVTDGTIKLKNLFAVAHFAITANDGTSLTKVGLRGKGVYASANVDLGTGAVTGVSEIGTEIDPEENIFFPAGKTDFYVTFVPGSVAPSFDGYYSESYTSVVTATPEERNYDADKSFVYYGNAKAKFSVSDNQQVAITNGNMQYVMPIATYTYDMRAKTLEANTLVRWKNSVPLKIKGTHTVQPGYYRLAPEQWEMAMPKTSRKNATYDIETITVGNDIYASPEKYRIFDLPSWGTLNKPTLLNNEFTASSDEVVKQYDYGHMLKVGNQETRVMTSDEWEYLMPTQGNLLLPTNNRTWRASGVKAAKWIRCHIKALYEQRADDPVWLRGFLIFPDNMPYSEAKALFKESNVTFGINSRADDNETTFEKIRNSGAVFIPFSAYRAGGSNRLVQWGVHGNYATTSRYALWQRVYHIKITPYPIDGVNFKVWTDPNQGCAVRLVQDL